MLKSKYLNKFYEDNSLDKQKNIFTFLDDQGLAVESLSFSQLDSQACQIAAYLRGSLQIKKGSSVLLMYSPGLEFLKVLLGCAYAGLVAIPLMPPDPAQLRQRMQTLCGIVEDSKSEVCLSTPEMIRMLRLASLAGNGLPKKLQFLAVNAVASPTDALVNLSEEGEGMDDEDAPVMLQYSSGSTGQPKGVMLTHSNIYGMALRIRKAFGFNAQSNGISWLPMYHDMGLIGHFFAPLFGNAHSMMMSPLSFLKRPILWLEVISKYHLQVSGAPNFAYEILANKYADYGKKLDLSCWRIAYCGAEPVRASTVHKFIDAFSKHGFQASSFYPVYGMAEATLLVSCPDSTKPDAPTILHISKMELARNKKACIVKPSESSQPIVGLGKVDDTKFLVVDPVTKKVCPQSEVGEFWISNECVSRGYWNKEILSKEFFGAFTTDNQGPFLRTGDLGFVTDGEIFFVSRLKEIIIINGVNHSPYDIEETVENSHLLLRKGCCAAFSLENGSKDSVWIVVEIKRDAVISAAQEDEIKKVIQKNVFIKHSISIESYHILLVQAGTLPKTSSGKLRRLECKRMTEENKLSIVQHGKTFSRKMRDMPKELFNFIAYFLSTIYNFPKAAFSKLISYSSTSTDPAASAHMKLQKQLESVILKHLEGVSSIDYQTPLFEYGLRSIDAVAICSEIEGHLEGRKLSATCFYEYYTIEKLATYILNPEIAKEVLEEDPINLQSFPMYRNEMNIGGSKSYILAIGTALPERKYTQLQIIDKLIEGSKPLQNSSVLSKARRVFESCKVETRHFAISLDELLLLGSTEHRNTFFEKYAPVLAAQSAREAIQAWGGNKGDITHVLTVTCTGTIVPGLEFKLINELGLNRSAMRLSINFMGCFGALAALRTAQSIALSNPSFRVLVVCTELCSLHVQKDETRFDNLVGEAIFGDGSAAVIVGGDALTPQEKPLFEIMRSSCYALPDSEDKIQWNLSDSGWKVGLSPEIPIHFQRELPKFCNALLKEQSTSTDCIWAIHPGGKSVVEIIEAAFELRQEQTQHCWDILHSCGNMSSGSVLFILDSILKDTSADVQRYKDIVSLAFGPGLAMEGTLLRRTA